MAYRSFREFVDALEKAGELTRVTVPVDTDLLIAEWADREMKSPDGGKALLFEQPLVDGKDREVSGGDQYDGIAASAWPWRWAAKVSMKSRRKFNSS